MWPVVIVLSNAQVILSADRW